MPIVYFRPLEQTTIITAQTAFHRCTFQVITAHFVHHCTLKQALMHVCMYVYGHLYSTLEEPHEGHYAVITTGPGSLHGVCWANKTRTIIMGSSNGKTGRRSAFLWGSGCSCYRKRINWKESPHSVSGFKHRFTSTQVNVILRNFKGECLDPFLLVPLLVSLSLSPLTCVHVQGNYFKECFLYAYTYVYMLCTRINVYMNIRHCSMHLDIYITCT